MGEIVGNSVEFQESIVSAVSRIPFLKRFYSSDWSPHVLINEYMQGVETWVDLTVESPVTSVDINVVLNEAEKRGDV